MPAPSRLHHKNHPHPDSSPYSSHSENRSSKVGS